MRKIVILKGYLDSNIPVFPFPEKAALALGCLYRYKQIKERDLRAEIVLPGVNPLAADIIRQAKQNKQKALDEYAAKQLLACYGAPVTKEELAATVEEALASAKKIGYPVALKACSWEIMHKSGKGLIALNIENDNSAQR
ncbi:MAG: acetate--CoA ligase family protein [Desulfomicrobium escambiense]|nr:acetate--CoA ligase family protein [Desulfomicrobium escambiense]